MEAGHPYESNWQSWIKNERPILYYIQYDAGGVESISSFGNPAVWWVGIIAGFWSALMILKWLVKKVAETATVRDGRVATISCFLLVGYLSSLLPWAAVTRATFIYHYFPCMIFLVLMITQMFKESHPLWWYKFKWPSWKWLRVDKRVGIAVIYLVVVVVLFAAFYPVIAGVPVPRDYIENYLKWFPSWSLC